jgi:hypothetical protein
MCLFGCRVLVDTGLAHVTPFFDLLRAIFFLLSQGRSKPRESDNKGRTDSQFTHRSGVQSDEDVHFVESFPPQIHNQNCGFVLISCSQVLMYAHVMTCRPARRDARCDRAPPLP